MKRPPDHYTVTALSATLRQSRARTLQAIRDAGITLTPIERHYSDDRPTTRRNWRPLTKQEAEQVIRSVRARQGARLLARSRDAERTPSPPDHSDQPEPSEAPKSEPNWSATPGSGPDARVTKR